MKYSEQFFGSSELVLRLPSIMAFVIYNTFGLLLLYRYCPKILLPCYLLLLLNPYLLDFFALARGYALSIAFITMSVYYISIYFSSKKPKHLILFNIGAFLAVMSNFSTLNYYAAALFTYNIILFISIKNDPLNKENTYSFYQLNKINLVSVLLSGMVLYEPLRRISKMSLIDFGGKNGFLADTVSSVIYDLFYEMDIPDFYLTLIKAFVLILFIGTLIIIIRKILRKDGRFFKTNIPLVFMNLVLVCMVGITNLQHIILGNDFNTHRFALFFYPMFIINFVFLLIYIFNTGNKKTASLIVYFSVCVLMLNLYINHSFIYYKDWKWDQDTKFVIHKMKDEHERFPDKNIRLGVNWLLEPGTNFYRYIWDTKWLAPSHRRGINSRDDYFLVFKNDKEFEALSAKPILFSNEQTGLVLVKNSD
jgi:hypothetical protein